jgi:hypothetical protein
MFAKVFFSTGPDCWTEESAEERMSSQLKDDENANGVFRAVYFRVRDMFGAAYPRMFFHEVQR